MAKTELDYTDLEFIATEIDDVNNLLKITITDLFQNDYELSRLSPFARQFESVLGAAIYILNNKTEQIIQIFNMLWDANNGKPAENGEAVPEH